MAKKDYLESESSPQKSATKVVFEDTNFLVEFIFELENTKLNINKDDKAYII